MSLLVLGLLLSIFAPLHNAAVHRDTSPIGARLEAEKDLAQSHGNSGCSRSFSLGDQWAAMDFGQGGIQSEQLQVSYYELYYASLWF